MKIITAAIAASAVAGALIGLSPAASADPVPANCQVVPWGFLGTQQRAICDTTVRADGSWTRHRVVGIPAHNVPVYCSSYGGGYGGGYGWSNSTCSGGYFQPYQEVSNDIYPVNPEIVLPDEPGHLG